MADPVFPSALFDTWKDLMQQSSTFWSQATTVPPQPPDPARQWQQCLALWADSWSKLFAQAPSPEMFQKAQKMWSEHLETLAQGLAQVMGTEAFATMQNQCFAQQLAWQDKLAQAANPQLDMALRNLNLPSREQIDRLFERVMSLEERLDDIDDALRHILRRLREQAQATPVSSEV